MIRITLAILWAVLWLQPVHADVVYVPRSELGAYMVGKQLGEGIAKITQGVVDLRSYTGNYLAGYAALEGWRKELKACASCADRARLLASIEEMQAFLIQENRADCAGMEAARSLSIGNTASVDTIGRITGMSEMCERYQRELEIKEMKVLMKTARENFDRKVKAGDTSAYSEMGNWIHKKFEDSRAMSGEDRRYFSCSYFLAGARQGDVGSLVSLPHLCWLTKEEYREVAQLLIACTQTGKNDDRCADGLDSVAQAYSTSRPASRPYPMQADDHEALRIREAALRYWERRAAATPRDAAVAARLDIARQQAAHQKDDLQPAGSAGTPERDEIHGFMRNWCEGIRERSGQAEMLAYECGCFVRETDRHITEGRINWARTKREGIFNLDLVDSCVDRTAMADAWVVRQKSRPPGSTTTENYLACAHRAIAQDIPLDHLKQRFAAGWNGSIAPLCDSANAAARQAESTRAPQETRARPGQPVQPLPSRQSPESPSGTRSAQLPPLDQKRLDQQQRRCDSLLRTVEYAKKASLSNPVRHSQRLEQALTQYQRACGG